MKWNRSRQSYWIAPWLFIIPLALPLEGRGVERPQLSDADKDGYRTDRLRGGTDCNDQDASIHPGATEVCDGVDQDCDGQIDEGAGKLYYLDADLDTYGATGPGIYQCDPPAGHVTITGDCNDRDPMVHPGSLELIDLRDQDCDGEIDELSMLTGLALAGVSSASPRGLGDINGDGFGDFVVGGATASLYLGSATPSSIGVPAVQVASFSNAVCAGKPGTFVALGDLNRDGFDDFGVHCVSSTDYRANFLNLYAGRGSFASFDLTRISSTIVSPSSSQVLGNVASHPGDVDLDGYDDLVLGLPMESSQEPNAGRVVVLRGSSVWWPMNTSAATGPIEVRGRAGEQLGMTVAMVGDLDSDGYPDLAAKDLLEGGRERLLLFAGLGAQLGVRSSDESSAILYSDTYVTGISTGYVGDLSGDGTDDLALADGHSLFVTLNDDGPWYLSGLLLSFSTLADYSALYLEPVAGASQSLSFRWAGDYNGDHLGDVLVGAFTGAQGTLPAEGTVSLLLGLPLIVSASAWPAPSGLVDPCSTADCQVGSASSYDLLGDINGDGNEDFVVGGMPEQTLFFLAP